MRTGSLRAASLIVVLVMGCRAAAAQGDLPDAPSVAYQDFLIGVPAASCRTDLCTTVMPPLCCGPSANPFQRFIVAQRANPPMGSRQKLLLAGKDTIDPFNLLTILGTSAIFVASDPKSNYGPGVKGFAKNSSVVFTEGVTGELFGTFLIPSLARQDPRYHRMPNASRKRRVAHALYQVVWTASDSGKPMFNYATILGTIASDAVNDLYVPGRKLGAGASAARIGTAIATDPIDNFITEFLPDLARRINFRVVLLQRIVNRVALAEERDATE